MSKQKSKRTPVKRLKNLTKVEKAAVSKKIRKLRKEGKSQKRAVGEALGRIRFARSKRKKRK